MKVLLLIALLAAIGYYFYLQRTAPPPAEATRATTTDPAVPAATATASPSATAASAQSPYGSLAALLRQDVNGLPTEVDGPELTPTNAISIKRRVGTHAGERPEYRTLVQSCDLILQAGSQHASLRQACHTDQTRASFGGSLQTDGSLDHSVPASGRTTTRPDPVAIQAKAQTEIRQKYSTAWNTYRTQTVSQVQGLLASLESKTP